MNADNVLGIMIRVCVDDLSSLCSGQTVGPSGCPLCRIC